MERGGLYERLECFKPALDDFQSFLSQAPEHPAAGTAREAVLRLTRQVAHDQLIAPTTRDRWPKLPKARDFFEASRAGVADLELRRKLENASGRHLDHVAMSTPSSRPTMPNATRRAASRRSHRASRRIADRAQGQARSQRLQGVLRRGCGAGARLYRRSSRKQGREEGRQGQVDDHRGNRAQPRAAARRYRRVETDLGEYIVQLRHEPPSHIITPAIHLSKEDIGQLFTDKLASTTPPSPKS